MLGDRPHDNSGPPCTGARPPRPYSSSRRDAAWISLITTLSAIVYAGCSLTTLARFRAGAYDLGIFDQAVRSYSRFQAPVSMIKGVHNGFGAGFSLLGDHWSPVLAVLAPLYWIHDGPETLLVAQAALLALSIPFVWVYTRRSLDASPEAARHVVIAYAISWPLAETVAFDFHEAAFVPLLTAILLERQQAGRTWDVALPAAALLLVKEDMGLLVAGIGVFLLTQRRRLGVLFIVAGTLATFVATQVLIPRFGGRSDYYWAYSSLGRDPGEAAIHALTHPGDVVALLLTPPAKVGTLLLLLAPVLFTALFSPVTLALVPLLAERMLACSFPNWWAPRYHYSAFIVVIVFAGGVDGARRLVGHVHRRRNRPASTTVRRWAALALAVGVASIPFFSFGRMFTSGFYERTVRTRAAEHAVAAVPDGALVEAANNLAPALSARTRTLLWDRTPRWAPWVVADVGERTFPFRSVDQQSARVDALLAHGYRLVFQEGGYQVLSRDDRRPEISGRHP